MADRTPFPVTVVTPDGTVFDDQAQMVIVTGTGGDVGILNRHSPLVADLRVGTAKVQTVDGEWKVWATSEGFAKTADSEATVLIEEAIAIDDIDIAEVDRMTIAAGQELEKAEQDLRKADDRDAADPFTADVEKAQRELEWAEHLRKLATEAQ